MKHPHEGRKAEVYREHPPDKFGEIKLEWIGYTAGPDYADHPKGLKWNDTLKAWVCPAQTKRASRANAPHQEPPAQCDTKHR